LGRKKRRSTKRSGGKRCSWCQPSYIHGGGTNVHHRLPKSRGGTYDEQNLSTVPRHLHDAYNALFGSNPTAHEVARVLSEVWIDPKYRIIVELIEPAIEQT